MGFQIGYYWGQIINAVTVLAKGCYPCTHFSELAACSFCKEQKLPNELLELKLSCKPQSSQTSRKERGRE